MPPRGNGIDALRAKYRLGVKLLWAATKMARSARAFEDTARENAADSEYAFALALKDEGPIDRDGKRYSHVIDGDGLDRVEVSVIPVSARRHVQISGVTQ